MEVRFGYKPTPVGIIPEDWDLSTVGDEFAVQLGKMLDAERNVGLPKPYLGNRAVQWGRIEVRELPTVRMSQADLGRFRLQKGDLLVCEGGEVGRAAIWDAPIAECYYQKALHRLRPLRGFDARYLAAVLWQWSNRGVLANFVTQTSIAHLPRDKFLQVPIPHPPLPEQRAIADALSDVDALVASLNLLIAKKRDLKQASMQQLLTGQTRLPGFHAEWEVKRLGEIAELYQPETISQTEFTESGYPVYGANGVVGWYGRFNHESPQITISCRGNCGTINRTQGPAWITGNAMVVNLDQQPNVDKAFVYYALAFSDLSVLVTGSGIPQIVRGPLEMFAIRLPADYAEQSAIAAVLSDMDTELVALEAHRDKTGLLKQGMMQELLTGRTRLV